MYERLKKICKEKGTTVTVLCIQVTGSSGNLPTWKKGYMRSDYLLKCSEVLNVSVDYLLGKTDNPQPTEESKSSLTFNETKMLEVYGKLTETEQLRLIINLTDYIEKKEKGSSLSDFAEIAAEGGSLNKSSKKKSETT